MQKSPSREPIRLQLKGDEKSHGDQKGKVGKILTVTVVVEVETEVRIEGPKTYQSEESDEKESKFNGAYLLVALLWLGNLRMRPTFLAPWKLKG